jgi:hypothetical protein
MRSKYWSHCRLLSATINNDFLFFAKRWYLRSSLRMYVRPSVVYIYIWNYICVYTYILYIYIFKPIIQTRYVVIYNIIIYIHRII